MPFCQCWPCSESEDDVDKFLEIDNILIDHAKAIHNYKERSWCIPKKEFVVQWGHLSVQSQLVDFVLQPRDVSGDILHKSLHKVSNQDKPSSSNSSPDDDSIRKESKKKDGKEIHNVMDSDKEQLDQLSTSADDAGEITPLQGDTEASASSKSKKEDKSKLNLAFSKFKSIMPGKKNTEKKEESIEMSRGITITKQSKGITGTKHKKLDDAICKRKLCMYKTEYTNTSGQEQKFTFQTEKRTKSSVQVQIQKSIKIGGKIKLGLKLPTEPAQSIDPLSVTGEVSKEFQWTRTKSDTKESEEVWTVNNAVSVANNTTTVAELIVHEEEATAFFRVKHRVTPIFSNRLTSEGKPLPQEIIPIYIIPKSELKKKPENRKVEKVLGIDKSNVNNGFCDAFLKKDDPKKDLITDRKEGIVVMNTDPPITVNAAENYIEFETEGTVQCVYQAKQVIDVHHISLATAEKESQTDIVLTDNITITQSNN